MTESFLSQKLTLVEGSCISQDQKPLLSLLWPTVDISGAIPALQFPAGLPEALAATEFNFFCPVLPPACLFPTRFPGKFLHRTAAQSLCPKDLDL